MGVVTDLGSLLNTGADKTYYTAQLMYWTALYDANSEKLQKQTNLEEKYLGASESALGNTRTLTAHGFTVKEDNQNEAIAQHYAHLKVENYDQELSEELAELDIEYDTMKTMYETLVQELTAQEESYKQLTQTDASQTGLLQG